MNYELYIDEHPERIDIMAALAAVSSQRREYALRYRKEQDRRLCLSAYLLLQKALQEAYGIIEPPIFSFTPQGKPFLKDHSNIHFNLSHCRQAAVCVVSHRPVGIDIESIDAYDPELIAATMSDKEQDMIAKASSPPLAFIRLWTQKESLLKFLGQGLAAESLRSILDIDIPHRFITHENVALGYVYSLVFSV
ncbi:MAG: 4'-phosphopantetheinyl transferase superfamily protein [Prevotella sp.]|nr:4'-phosphopantetheinyl transferase superfamily protein [Prevotella sp.]